MEKVIDIEGLAVHYHEVGGGVPVLILPGWGGTAAYAKYRYERMFQWSDEYRRVYLDLPGHGRTVALDGTATADDFLNIVEEFAERVFDGNNYLIVGYSYGAYLARGLVYRSANKINGLYLQFPVIHPNDDKRTLPTFEILEDDPNYHHLIPEDYSIFLDYLPVRNEQLLTELAQDLAVLDKFDDGDDDFLEGIRGDISRYSFSFDVDTLSEPFDRPSLFLTGRLDIAVGYEDTWSILSSYPRATFVLLENAGHIQIGHDETQRRLLHDWLSRVKSE